MENGLSSSESGSAPLVHVAILWIAVSTTVLVVTIAAIFVSGSTWVGIFMLFVYMGIAPIVVLVIAARRASIGCVLPTTVTPVVPAMAFKRAWIIGLGYASVALVVRIASS
jgi:hypothetical protein